jgi:hypothetical protein
MERLRFLLATVTLAVAGCAAGHPAAPSAGTVASPTSPAPSASATAPMVTCDTAQLEPPASLACGPAIAVALAALAPGHLPILREEFRWGGLCPPGAPCVPPLGSDGVVIFDLAGGPPVFAYVTASGGVASASSPAPYPSGY